ncbi:CvpA family protein [Sulfurimonas paralvinellae]|uniref:CvpA family protein n=1 Tax=Sulfurimonas paralvinellae TaxID=317658 RepID=A0A7M1B8A5_9BACT|nr:CvpA family protein [Sulfurimonas paralvinellae]QOP45973.1 CvpA family protein [Sulfurimonas paralvinellae]
MDINYFDFIAAIIILLLGLKGILNGFFKELFGLIGIIGGIFIASRMGDSVGEYLSKLIFNFSNHAAISFTGFLVTLAVFWMMMIAVGYAFKKLTALSGLGIFDRILGFVFGASKFFLIAAVIAFAISNVKAFKPTLEAAFSNSVLFPVLVETGGFIMKIDPIGARQDINASLQNATQKVSDKIDEKTQEIVNSEVNKTVQEIKNKVQEK